MNIRKYSKRRAISPILATVILIAITLIAAVAIAGFVFGLFGSFTSTAQVSISSVSCTGGGTGTITCSMVARNTGSGSTSLTSISATYGALFTGVVTTGGPLPISVPAGASPGFTVKFTDAIANFTTGTTVTGQGYLANGGSVSWSGTIYSS